MATVVTSNEQIREIEQLLYKEASFLETMAKSDILALQV